MKASSKKLLERSFMIRGHLACCGIDTDLGAPADWMELERLGFVQPMLKSPLGHRYSFALTEKGIAHLESLSEKLTSFCARP